MPIIVRTSGGLWGPPTSFYYHVLAQLLLAAYQQPGTDVSGSQNGQTDAQTSPLDSPMRCRVAGAQKKVPFNGHIFAGRVLRVSAVARRAAAAYGDAILL